MKSLRYWECERYKTKIDETGHIHDVAVDANGDGKTSGGRGHRHEVLQWMIQPANDHVHNGDFQTLNHEED